SPGSRRREEANAIVSILLPTLGSHDPALTLFVAWTGPRCETDASAEKAKGNLGDKKLTRNTLTLPSSRHLSSFNECERVRGKVKKDKNVEEGKVEGIGTILSQGAKRTKVEEKGRTRTKAYAVKLDDPSGVGGDGGVDGETRARAKARARARARTRTRARARARTREGEEQRRGKV
ncbi:hypothetical protein V1478_018156, partial [Vespula squamosa]